MTDHKTIFLKLNLSQDNKMMFNHWKCNSSLICKREFTEVVKKTNLSISIGNLQFLILSWRNIGNYLNTKSENVQFNLVKIWLKRKNRGLYNKIILSFQNMRQILMQIYIKMMYVRTVLVFSTL